jgi:DNA primase catalytic subunit
VATVNYSAMEDLVNKIDAYPIKIGTRFKEMETQAIRVYPDNDDLINIIEKYLNLPDPIKVQKKIKTRKLTEQHFNWENIVKKWEKYFDALIQSNSFGKWDTITKAKLIPSINKDIIFSDKIPNIEKLSYISNIIKHPAFSMNSTFMLDILDRLDNGFYFENQKAKQFTWNDALIIFDSIISNNNICVEVLVNKNPIEEDFISYANIKDPNIQ